MKNKIFDKITEEKKQFQNELLHELNIIEENDSIKKIIEKKNMDLNIILCKLELIEENPENGDIIDEYHDSLFKSGIEVGVNHGKQMIITAIKTGSITLKEIMEINPEDFVKYNYYPPVNK